MVGLGLLLSVFEHLISIVIDGKMNGLQPASAPECPVGSVCSIEGLPPLPKGLSGILNSSGGSWRDIEKVYSKKTRIQADISKSRFSDSLGRSKPASLDAALAVLRKEMVRGESVQT